MSALLVDLGGTQTRVATLEAGRPSQALHFSSRELPGLAEALATVHKRERTLVASLAAHVDGPKARITNLDFSVDAEALAADFGFSRVLLTNDLVAHGVGLLTEERPGRVLSPLALGGSTRRPQPSLDRGPVAVVAPGTGFGEAVFERLGSRVVVRATEGGHGAFAVQDELGLQYVQRVAEHRQRAIGSVSVEDALSGHALGLLYRFLIDERGVREPKALRAQVERAQDPNKEVMRLGLAESGRAAPMVLQLYTRWLATEVKSFVLKHLAFGGVILAGGILTELGPRLGALEFSRWFCGEGPYTPELSKVPLAVTKSAGSALDGCAVLAGPKGRSFVAGSFGLFEHRQR